MSAKLSSLKISRKAKIIIGIIVSVVVITSVAVGLFLAWKYMFRQNDRFYVVHVNVSSAEGKGKWHGKVEEVMPHVIEAKIDKKTEKDDEDKEDKMEILPIPEKEPFNIFEIDIRKLREKLEKVPEIEKVEVIRILPNTLDIRVIERIPVAFIGSRKSEYMVDKDGVVIRKKHSIEIGGLLPVIRNFKEKKPQAGETFEEVKSVLEFIRLYREVSDYAVLKIVEMDLSKEDYVTMKIHYGGDAADSYTILNVPRKDPAEGMDRIFTSIDKIKKEDPGSRTIDLRYKGQSVVKKAPNKVVE